MKTRLVLWYADPAYEWERLREKTCEEWVDRTSSVLRIRIKWILVWVQ